MQFANIYYGHSLFHLFATEVEIIESIHQNFTEALADNELTESEKQMSFVILRPDPYGKTAIDIAYEKERPRSADLMLEMLEPFNDCQFSKLLISSMPNMVREGSPAVYKYFNSMFYRMTNM